MSSDKWFLTWLARLCIVVGLAGHCPPVAFGWWLALTYSPAPACFRPSHLWGMWHIKYQYTSLNQYSLNYSAEMWFFLIVLPGEQMPSASRMLCLQMGLRVSASSIGPITLSKVWLVYRLKVHLAFLYTRHLPKPNTRQKNNRRQWTKVNTVEIYIIFQISFGKLI